MNKRYTVWKAGEKNYQIVDNEDSSFSGVLWENGQALSFSCEDSAQEHADNLNKREDTKIVLKGIV